MFSTSVATGHFYFVLDLANLFVGPNHLPISLSYHDGSLLSGCFRFLGYHLTTALVHLLSENLSTCPAEQTNLVTSRSPTRTAE